MQNSLQPRLLYANELLPQLQWPLAPEPLLRAKIRANFRIPLDPLNLYFASPDTSLHAHFLPQYANEISVTTRLLLFLSALVPAAAERIGLHSASRLRPFKRTNSLSPWGLFTLNETKPKDPIRIPAVLESPKLILAETGRGRIGEPRCRHLHLPQQVSRDRNRPIMYHDCNALTNLSTP